MNGANNGAENGTRKLGWGIAGCGWVTRDYVAPAIRVSKGGEAVALLDLDPAALETTGRVLPEAARHTDLDEFLATPGLDAVYVATPHHAHTALVEAAASAGKHVLCEKPMANTVEDAEKMVAACEAADVVYATAFDQRYHAAHRRLRGLISDGTLGTITMARIHYACWLPPEWEPETADAPHDNWRVDPIRAGGGALADLAPHGLDLLQTLLGEEIVELAGLKQRRVFDYPVEDGAALVVSFSGGALATIHNAFNCPDTLPRRTLEVYGTKAAAITRNTMGQVPGGTLELIPADGERQMIEIPPEEDVSPFLSQVEAFEDTLLEDRPYPFPPERDLHTMRLLQTALHSGGAWVEPAERA